MHGLSEIRKLNAVAEGKLKPMENIYGGRVTNPPHTPRTLADRVAEQKAAGFTPGVGHQDRIESAIDQTINSPFMKFWQNHNDTKGEIAYGEARKLFGGGPTPEGALIRADKGDGLRAIPGSAFSGRPTWYGQFREVTGEGTKWHTVVNADERPIIYTDPSFALDAAEHERSVRIEQAFR